MVVSISVVNTLKKIPIIVELFKRFMCVSFWNNKLFLCKIKSITCLVIKLNFYSSFISPSSRPPPPNIDGKFYFYTIGCCISASISEFSLHTCHPKVCRTKYKKEKEKKKPVNFCDKLNKISSLTLNINWRKGDSLYYNKSTRRSYLESSSLLYFVLYLETN